MPFAALVKRLESLMSDHLTAGQCQFVKFVIVGGLNTIVGYGIFALLVLARLAPGVSLFLATTFGVLFNYMTTGRLVFAARGFGRLPFFVAVYGLTFLINLWSLRTLISLGTSPFLAQAILLLPIVILNFTLNKIFIFPNVRAP